VAFRSGTRDRDVHRAVEKRQTGCMARKAAVVIEKDEHGFYAWRPELKGCQSQGLTLEEVMANIKEAAELYLETLPADERDVLLSREILTTAVEVNA
jgi:predicted RNase H-like HicB family nuclease